MKLYSRTVEPALATFLFCCIANACSGGESETPGPLPNPGVPANMSAAPAPDSLQGPPGPTSVGPVHAADTYTTLVETIGAENIRDTAYPTGEGATRPGIVLYPDSREAITAFFEDPSSRTGVAEVAVAHPRSTYLVQGLRVGMTIEEAQAVNGAPFRLAGLGWDYGGHSRDWGADGRVSPNVTAVFRPRTRRAVPPPAQGDTLLASDSELWRGLGMYIVELRAGLADR